MMIKIAAVTVDDKPGFNASALDDMSDILGLSESEPDNEPRTFEKLLRRVGKRIDDARAANVKGIADDDARRSNHEKAQTQKALLGGGKYTVEEVWALAGSVLGQDETRGKR